MAIINPAHDALFIHANVVATYSTKGTIAPKHPLPENAAFLVSNDCFMQLCKESPRMYLDRQAFGIPVMVDKSLKGFKFSLSTDFNPIP